MDTPQILDNLVAWGYKGGPHKFQPKACPGCKEDCSRTGITKLLYLMEACDCGNPAFVHLIEQLWHKACYHTAMLQGASTSRT